MPQRNRRPIQKSLQEYGRGIAGGLLVSLPLLYTMEVWWTGFVLETSALLAALAATFLLLLGYNRFGGMRPGIRLLDVIIDSIEELGLGILLATLVLYLLGRITPGMPWNEILGKIVVESIVVSIGVSVGTAQLGAQPKEGEDEMPGSPSDKSGEESSSGASSRIFGQIVLAFCGAVLFSANIAPTQEVVIIAIEASTAKLIGLAGLSLATGALILHYSDFLGTGDDTRRRGRVAILLEPAASYATALLASAMMLWFFRRFDDVSFATGVSEVVVLGFAGNLGPQPGDC